MIRPAALGLLTMALMSGCATARPPLVYVDLDRAAGSSPFNLRIDTPLAPPAPPAGSSSQLEALSAQRLDFSENASRLAKVQEEVRIAQEETIRQLTTELRQSYLKEVDELERTRLGEIDDTRREAFDRAWVRLRARFELYASERGPDAIRLAVYAGFPNPSLVLDRQATPWSNAERRQLERGRALRTKLKELKQAFDGDMDEIIAEAGEEVAATLNRLRLEMEERRAAAEARAEREANQQTLELVKDLESVLSGKSEVILPPKPGVKITTDAPKPLPNPPVLDTREAESLLRGTREAVRSEVEIWAAQQGYELTLKKGAPDRTDEFLEWRNRTHPGL